MLTKLTENLNVHQSLPDQPALTSAQLKQKFDESSNKIKDYINNTLIGELDTAIENLRDDNTVLSNLLTQTRTTLAEVVSNLNNLENNGTVTKFSKGTSVPSSLANGEVYFQYF